MSRSEEFADAAEFARRYTPREWGGSWNEVQQNLASARHPRGSGAKRGATPHRDLANSLKEFGMMSPVQVENGSVRDGHHRVAAALTANVPVRYTVKP